VFKVFGCPLNLHDRARPDLRLRGPRGLLVDAAGAATEAAGAGGTRRWLRDRDQRYARGRGGDLSVLALAVRTGNALVPIFVQYIGRSS
jgi:hypothetical protein